MVAAALGVSAGLGATIILPDLGDFDLRTTPSPAAVEAVPHSPAGGGEALPAGPAALMRLQSESVLAPRPPSLRPAGPPEADAAAATPARRGTGRVAPARPRDTIGEHWAPWLNPPPAGVVFVVDVSAPADPYFRAVTRAVVGGLARLPEGTRFALVAYGREASAFPPVGLVRGEAEDLVAAITWLLAQRPRADAPARGDLAAGLERAAAAAAKGAERILVVPAAPAIGGTRAGRAVEIVRRLAAPASPGGSPATLHVVVLAPPGAAAGDPPGALEAAVVAGGGSFDSLGGESEIHGGPAGVRPGNGDGAGQAPAGRGGGDAR